MLAPEVWNIETKQTRKTEYRSEFKRYNKNHIDALIRSHHFNHNVSLTFAGDTEVPQEIKNILMTDNEYYLIKDVMISEFYDQSFIELFAQKGELTVLSINDDIHSQNTFAMLPNRHFILRLLEDTYTRLGIDGKRIKIWSDNQYVIDLDLNKKAFTSGKLYHRYRQHLLNSNLRFDLLIIWEPFDSAICPSSIASYFYKKSYNVSSCAPRHTVLQHFEKNLPNPFSDESEDFLHWFGVHMNERNGESKKSDDFPTPNIITHKWSGFFSATRILHVWQDIKKRSNELKSEKSWISVYVSGFQNSPVTFGLSIDDSFKKNDDFFTIFCTSQDHCIMYPSKCIKTK